MTTLAAEQRRREHELRLALTERVKAELGFNGPHMYYSCTLQSGKRRPRKVLFRNIETMCITANSREECGALLDEMATRMGASWGWGASG